MEKRKEKKQIQFYRNVPTVVGIVIGTWNAVYPHLEIDDVSRPVREHTYENTWRTYTVQFSKGFTFSYSVNVLVQ